MVRDTYFEHIVNFRISDSMRLKIDECLKKHGEKYGLNESQFWRVAAVNLLEQHGIDLKDPDDNQ